MMKLGFVSAILPELNLDQVLAFAEDPTFGAALEGRQRALRVARNVLEPFFA